MFWTGLIIFFACIIIGTRIIGISFERTIYNSVNASPGSCQTYLMYCNTEDYVARTTGCCFGCAYRIAVNINFLKF